MIRKIYTIKISVLTIVHPLTGDKIQVANEDFSNCMTWNNAIEACEKLGKGWRLPSIDELKIMYNELHKKEQCLFSHVYSYWSSTEHHIDGVAWSFGFDDGEACFYPKVEKKKVRALRTL